MPLDLSEILVIGVSSRSLFNLEEENKVFEEQGIEGFRKYQAEKEDEILEPGTAFYLVKSLLELNNQANKKIVEVVVMSKNSPETGVRVLNSIKHLGLDITRLAFSGGEPLAPYIDAFDIDLFLSKDEKDVQVVIDSGISAAATIYDPPTSFDSTDNRVKIAFDADAVLFDEESELRYKTEGMEAFHKHEAENEDNPLKEGPFANLLRKLSAIQEHLPTSIELTPLRIAIVTARNAPSHMRVIKTLRNWGVYVDEAYFMGGVSKDKVLKAFGAHIFFDDQDTHLAPASKVVPSGKVPYASKSPLKKLNEDEQKEILDKIKSLDGLNNDEKAYLVNLVNTKKKYGLVWEDKPEDVEEELRTKLPVLKEVKERAIINDTETEKHPNHILIEGDNLHALTALTFTHEGKIDIIYIDPPYNTGSKEDFIYNDHYVDKEDAFRHSKWLSFMERRLNIAKRLLSDDGVMFISIGDDEIAQLTMLCNEVFGENNQLGLIARVAKTAGDKGSYFAPSKDYVIAFAKNKLVVPDFKDAVDESLFKKVETEGPKKGEKYRDDVAFYQSSLDPMRGCTNQRYWIKAPDGSYLIPPGNIVPEVIADGEKIPPKTKEDKVWRWSQETYLQKKDLLVFKVTKKSPLQNEKGERAKYNIYTKSYLADRSDKGKSPRDYLDQFINRKGADFIKQYDIDFSFSKPFELIEHFVKITNKPNDITVLDFFAGSGTALHSVLSLNESDKGSRKCIITTNNENNICDNVTYPRVERIIKGYTNQKGKEMPSFPNNNLFMYRCDFVDREPSLSNKRQLTKLATELLCIKEDCYQEITSQLANHNWHKFFTGAKGNYVYVVYDDMHIEEAVSLLTNFISTNKEAKIKVYVFSNGQYPYAEEFEDVANNITLAALPDAIYKAYQNVLPKQNKEFIPELEEESPEEFDKEIEA